ncbi:NifB/NifX family molybdenum-iron cluster-binding protein, partial [bacterium]|nr:NifB/NifX family molybdenum-iron cluster-binding protein [bacterium]
MKICIPTVTNNGIDSKISGHFGSSPYFVVYNTADSALEVTQNSLKEHI